MNQRPEGRGRVRSPSSSESLPSVAGWDSSEEGQEDFSFRLSRYEKGFAKRDGAMSPAKEKTVEKKVATNVPQVGKVLYVLKSHYEGDWDVSSGGERFAELKVSEELPAQNRQSQSLFKWL